MQTGRPRRGNGAQLRLRSADGLADRSLWRQSRSRAPALNWRARDPCPGLGRRWPWRTGTSPRIRRTSRLLSRAWLPLTALTSGNGQVRPQPTIWRAAAEDRDAATLKRACDLRFHMVAGVGFEPT